MSLFSANFRQSPAETKRYVMQYALQLAPGESILSVVANVTQIGTPTSPALAVTGIALLPAVGGVVPGAAFFVSGGTDQGRYEVQFIGTTSVGQVLEDVVSYTLAEKL